MWLVKHIGAWVLARVGVLVIRSMAIEDAMELAVVCLGGVVVVEDGRDY